MEELLSLKWNNHKSTFLHILTVLRDKQLYTDSTIACEGKFYSVHKLVLSTCSDYFSAMFDKTDCKNPVIVLKDINCVDLEALLDYMYLGEVNVKQSELSSLIKAAECLQVKGLAVPDDDAPPKKSSRKAENFGSPSAKRKKRSESDISLPKFSQPRQSTSDTVPAVPDAGVISKPSTSNNTTDSGDKIPFVKVEKEDDIIEEETYEMNNSNFKEETSEHIDSAGDVSSDMPEFMEPNDGSFPDQVYAEASYQSGESDWPPEGSNFNDPLTYGSDDTSPNPSGVLDEITCMDQTATNKISFSSDCPICGKKFPSGWRMTRHLKIHTGEKPFSCRFCSFTSNHQMSIRRHEYVKHDIRKFDFAN